MKTYKNIDEYIESYPEEVQALLKKIRETIKKVAPNAREDIKYGIPTFIQNGNLVHFGGYKDHIGFYPTPSGLKTFSKELSKYQSGKGTARFPLDKPLPLNLVTKIVKFRLKEDEKKKDLGGSLPFIGAPATRALAGIGVTKLKQLTKFTEADLIKLHGFGPKALRILKESLKQNKLSFSKKMK